MIYIIAIWDDVWAYYYFFWMLVLYGGFLIDNW